MRSGVVFLHSVPGNSFSVIADSFFILSLSCHSFSVLQVHFQGDVTISMASSLTQLRGTFQILSLSGSYLPHCNSLSITLVASKEKVVLGMVEGILLAAGPVDIIVGSCINPALHRPRLIPPNGRDNTGRPGPPVSVPIGCSPSLDSSHYNS